MHVVDAVALCYDAPNRAKRHHAIPERTIDASRHLRPARQRNRQWIEMLHSSEPDSHPLLTFAGGNVVVAEQVLEVPTSIGEEVLAAMFGVNPWRLMAWLGHKRIDETHRYVHVAEAHAREIPPELIAAANGELNLDRRVLKMISARVKVPAKAGPAWHPGGTNENASGVSAGVSTS